MAADGLDWEPADWWVGAPVEVQLAFLAVLFPGVLLHELTHAVVAAPFAEVEWDWDHSAVRLHWRAGTPLVVVWFALMAPLVVGWSLGAVVVYALLNGATVRLPWWLAVFACVQWSIYTLAILGDIQELGSI